MTMHNLLITGALHPDAQKAFEDHPSFNVYYLPDLPRLQLLDRIEDIHILVTRSETTIDRELIDKATNLQIIGRAAVGVGNIDISYATEKGILVINTPGKNTNSAAEMTMTLLMGMLRNLPEAYNKMKAGGWDRHTFTGNELRGKKIGLVGIGHVGHRVAKFCNGFDMQVFGFDPYVGSSIFERNSVLKVETLEELVGKVDILSVHVPLNEETRGMIGAELLNQMAPGTWVVNAARGGIIAEGALLEALDSGHIAGAAIDTFDDEPAPRRDLVDHPRVYVSPHIGASTIEAQKLIGDTIVEQIKKAAEGGVVDFPVNLPRIGVVENPLLKPYAILAEKLGSFSAQILDFNPTEIEISYRGDLAEQSDHTFINLGFKKGYLTRAVDTFVSYVNANTHFDQLGISISEAMDPDFNSYRSALKIKIKGAKGKLLSVGGIVFDGCYPRISLVNDFYFEVDPDGEFIVMENEDKPGVVGAIGTFLAENGVNIDSFDLARNKKGGKAMSMIKIDSRLSNDSSRRLKILPHITRSHIVSL